MTGLAGATSVDASVFGASVEIFSSDSETPGRSVFGCTSTGTASADVDSADASDAGPAGSVVASSDVTAATASDDSAAGWLSGQPAPFEAEQQPSSDRAALAQPLLAQPVFEPEVR